MKKLISNILYFTLFFTVFLPNAFSWDATGHKIIAAIAYENLTPETKAKVDQLTCIFDKSNYNGHCNESENAKLTRFMFDATWADLLRGENVPEFDDWHFIDNPKNSKQPKNVVWAINESKKVLTKWQYDIYEKAVFLRFLLHFAGDAHQPLHCINHGDKGGNLIPINSQYAENLHEYWDRGLGEFCSKDFYQNQQYQNFRHYKNNYYQNKNNYYQNYQKRSQCHPLTKKELFKLANYIEYKYPKNYFGNKANDLNPKNWAIESYDTALNFAYNVYPNSKPSYQYEQEGRKIALERIALAGYRLANLLNNLPPNLAAASSKPLRQMEAIDEVRRVEK